MKRLLARASLSVLVAAATAATGCVATTTTWTTSTIEEDWSRYGTVVSVEQMVQRTEGNPVAGAIAGAVIGGVLVGGDETSTLIGAAAGAAVGAAASDRHEERASSRVWVQFEDGGRQVFTFRGRAPFRPGAPVVLTPRGLLRA
jgi:outer membrane lipoprotein SlyB